ncbi:hypothetical protein D0Y65_025832 [Glycine soja]|uniref:Uncharacterized protein n=1 Tax=Glycine soja TaxID=3848 RepID=A0A445IH86_GLYSO|nr:hypothetical protein D0Y65_025832 [Glycine soja]
MLPLVVVLPLTIWAVMVGQQSPDFGIWIKLLAVERVTGCILEESIESRLCYGLYNLMEASMKMFGWQNFMKFVWIVTCEMWSVATQFFSLMSVVAHKFVCVSFFLPQLLVDFVWSAGICY